MGFNAITNRSLMPPKLAGYNIYRLPLPTDGQTTPTPLQIVDPRNLAGSIDAGAASFVDIVATDKGANFIYAITSLSADGLTSLPSQAASSSIPVIINPVWDSGRLLIRSRGSFIAPTGAVLIVNEVETYPLQLNETGDQFLVPKSAKGSPRDKKLKKVIKSGRLAFLQVRNPDGKTSVGNQFMRE